MLLFTNSKFCKLLLPNKKSLVWVLSLLFVLGNVIQSFGQMARPSTFVEFPFPAKVYSKNSAFRWIYPTVTGSPINDIGHSFAVGESGYFIKLGSIDFQENFFFDFNDPLDRFNNPSSLDFKKVLTSSSNYFLAETQNKEIFFYLGLPPIQFERSFYWRKQIPDSLVPYQVIGFQSVGKGYIVKNNMLYTTSDSATTWQEVGTLPFQNTKLLYSFSPNQILINHGQDSLVVSFNNGLNFTNATGISGAIKHLESTNGKLIFATTSNGFFTSNDSGRVWQSIPNIPFGTAKYICPIKNRKWYLAVDNRLYKTLDSGITFIQHQQVAPDTIKIIKPMADSSYHILLNDGRYFCNYTNFRYGGNSNYGDNFFVPFSNFYGPSCAIDETNRDYATQVAFSVDSVYSGFGRLEIQRMTYILNNNGVIKYPGFFNTNAIFQTDQVVAVMSNKGPKWFKNTRNQITYRNTTSFASYPWATKLLHLNNKLLLFKPNTTAIPFLPSNDVRASLDSIPFVANDPLVDINADLNLTNDTVYGLCASGNVYIQKATGNIRIATLSPDRTIVPKQLAMGAKVRGIVRKVGVLDTANHIYAGAINGGRLRQITGNLNKPILDFVIAGDSVFVLSTKNRYYVTALNDTANWIWQGDSIHSSRTFNKMMIDGVGNNLPAFGRSRLENYRYYEYGAPSILFLGSGNSVISSTDSPYYNTYNSVPRKHIAHLNIYPNPTVNKTFRISETGIKQLVLSDLQGRRLATLTPDASDELTFTIPAFIANGYYLLNGVLNGKTYTGKVMVK